MNERIKLSGAAILLGENRVRSLSSSMSRSGIALVVGLIRIECNLNLLAEKVLFGRLLKNIPELMALLGFLDRESPKFV